MALRRKSSQQHVVDCVKIADLILRCKTNSFEQLERFAKYAKLSARDKIRIRNIIDKNCAQQYVPRREWL